MIAEEKEEGVRRGGVVDEEINASVRIARKRRRRRRGGVMWRGKVKGGVEGRDVAYVVKSGV